MAQLLSNIRIDVSDKIYLKDPNSSDLGRAILREALPLIDTLGMERFTFKKLSAEITTTESAIYRYFESKNRLLLYYLSWYWACLEYQVAFGTANIESNDLRLEAGIRMITEGLGSLASAPFDLALLQHVVISESPKAYCTKEIDNENREGLYNHFKSLVARLSILIKDFAPHYAYPNSLATLLIESLQGQLFFAEHLPSLSDLGADDEHRYLFYKELVFRTIA